MAVEKLTVKNIKYLPGEADAALDACAAYKEFFPGPTHYSFNHKGLHCIVLDTATTFTKDQYGSVPNIGLIENTQLEWLKAELAPLDKETPIAVFSHFPLFPLFPKWGWTTNGGDKVIQALMPYKHVTVFYGHIHQENHYMTGHIAHHSAKSTTFLFPAPGSLPDKIVLPCDQKVPYKNLGIRHVEVKPVPDTYTINEIQITS